MAVAEASPVDHAAVQEHLVAEGKRMLAALAHMLRDVPTYAQYASALDTALVAIYADISNSKVRAHTLLIFDKFNNMHVHTVRRARKCVS